MVRLSVGVLTVSSKDVCWRDIIQHFLCFCGFPTFAANFTYKAVNPRYMAV